MSNQQRVRKGRETFKEKARAILYLITALAAVGVTVFLSLLALPNIPILSYTARTCLAIALFIVVVCAAGIDAMCRAAEIINPVEAGDSATRRWTPNGRIVRFWLVWAAASFAILVLVCIVSPGRIAYSYYLYSLATSSFVAEGDDTCRSIEEALEKEPSNSEYLREAGAVYYKMGDYDKSLGYCSEALRHCGEGDRGLSAKIQFLMGKAYLRGHPDDSEHPLMDVGLGSEDLHYAQWMFRSSSDKEDGAECRFNLAVTQYYQYLQDKSNDGLYDKSLQNFDRAIEFGDGFKPQYYYWRGCLKYQKDSCGALDDLQTAANASQYKASYQFALGLSHRARKEYGDSRTCFTLASNLEPGNEVYRDYREQSLDNFGEGSWGDSDGGRLGYTLSEVHAGEFGSQVVLNSVTDGILGDERNFVGAKAAREDGAAWYSDTVDVHDGETYTVRLLVRNDNPVVTARDVEAMFYLPHDASKSLTVTGCLSCAGAEPDRCWDSVVFNSSEYFYLEYVDGSAKYEDRSGSVELPNEIILTETAIGGGGSMSSGNDDYGVVSIDVKVRESVGAALQMKVRLKGDQEWAEYVEAQVGDEVEYQIAYTNLLAETVDDVMIRDVLPNNVRYKEGSTSLYNSYYPEGTPLDNNTVTSSGINIGSYQSGGRAYVRFAGIVTDNTLAEGSNQLVNWASATIRPHDGEAYVYKDDASVFCSLLSAGS